MLLLSEADLERVKRDVHDAAMTDASLVMSAASVLVYCDLGGTDPIGYEQRLCGWVRAMCEGDVDIPDMLQTLREETGISITINGGNIDIRAD